MTWYHKLPLPSSKAAKIRRASKPDRAVVRKRNKIKIRPVGHVFYKTFSRVIYINGIGVKVCTRNGIARFFGVEHSTILRWANHNVLPEPFYHVSTGKGYVPVYLATQINVLRRVLQDFVDTGYMAIPWGRCPAHIEMLHHGYEQCGDRAYKKFEPSNDVEKADEFGVIFHN